MGVFFPSVVWMAVLCARREWGRVWEEGADLVPGGNSVVSLEVLMVLGRGLGSELAPQSPGVCLSALILLVLDPDAGAGSSWLAKPLSPL